MEDLSPALSILGTLFSSESALERGKAAALIGRRKKQASEFEATQQEQNAVTDVASGQRNALSEARKVALLNSTALARAAAGGGGATDPSVISAMAFIANEGAYRQASALYQGEAEARLARLRAIGARFEGDTAVLDAQNAQRASKTAAASTLFSGGAKAYSMYSKYWQSPTGAEGFDIYSGNQAGYSSSYSGGSGDYFSP